MIYNIRFTDINKNPISINEGTVDNSTDLSLYGRVDLEYGQQLDVDLLRLLENFSAPENTAIAPNDRAGFLNPTPDFSQISDASLRNPIQGQLWFNSTRQRIYVYTGTQWEPLALSGDISANWGTIFNGEQIPPPQSPITGHIFDYSECVWVVSPANCPQDSDYMLCTTDSNAVVTMVYQPTGSVGTVGATANYLIVGIRNNSNPLMFPTLTPSPTPTITPSNTPTSSPNPLVSPTPSPTVPPTPTPTAQPTVTPTPSPILPLQASLSTTTLSTVLPNNGTACGAEIMTSSPVSVSISGGVAPYSIQWVNYSSNTMTINYPNNTSTTFSATVGPQSTITGSYYAVITDANGSVINSNRVNITLTNNQPACAPTTQLAPSTNLSNFGLDNSPNVCNGYTATGSIEFVIKPDGTWYLQSTVTNQRACNQYGGMGGAQFIENNGGTFQTLNSIPYSGYWSATPTPTIGNNYTVQLILTDNTASVPTLINSGQVYPYQEALPSSAYTISNTASQFTSLNSQQSVAINASYLHSSPVDSNDGLAMLSNFTLTINIKSNDGTQQLSANLASFNLNLTYGIGVVGGSLCNTVMSGTNVVSVPPGAACPI